MGEYCFIKTFNLVLGFRMTKCTSMDRVVILPSDTVEEVERRHEAAARLFCGTLTLILPQTGNSLSSWPALQPEAR
jgi:hypothetical protein